MNSIDGAMLAERSNECAQALEKLIGRPDAIAYLRGCVEGLTGNQQQKLDKAVRLLEAK